MLLNRGKNPIMLGAPGVPAATVGLQKLKSAGSAGSVGLVLEKRVAKNGQLGTTA